MARRGTGDWQRVVELVNAAVPIFRDHGMQPFIVRATRLADDLGVHIQELALKSASSAGDLSEWEIEVLVRVTQGRTRDEIAGDLLLSHRTVDRHLVSIFEKIGVGDEAAAAAYAREKGLTALGDPNGPRA